MAGSLSLLLVASACVAFALADYCNIETCQDYHKGTQTMCKYPQSGPAQRCLAKGDMGSGMLDDGKNAILSLHNELRQKVASGGESQGNPGPQPAATSMPDLTWDDELAMVAQRWADQCIWDHDDCRDVGRYQVGQNIAYRSTTGDPNDINIEDMINDWYNEVSDFDSSLVTDYVSVAGPMTGHYSQLVWGKTTKVGCGIRIYFDGSMNRKYLVCNYGPAGNMKHESVYETQ